MEDETDVVERRGEVVGELGLVAAGEHLFVEAWGRGVRWPEVVEEGTAGWGMGGGRFAGEVGEGEWCAWSGRELLVGVF